MASGVTTCRCVREGVLRLLHRCRVDFVRPAGVTSISSFTHLQDVDRSSSSLCKSLLGSSVWVQPVLKHADSLGRVQDFIPAEQLAGLLGASKDKAAQEQAAALEAAAKIKV